MHGFACAELCQNRMGRLLVLSPPHPCLHQEEDFLRPSSREEAQKLWEMERLKMRQVLDKQQKQMVEDYQWLRQEEKSLVGDIGLGTDFGLCAPSSRIATTHQAAACFKQHNHNCSTPQVSQQACSSSSLCTAGGVRAAPITNPLAPLCVLHLAEL